MSLLWAYGRRPSCTVRYRHGGYNAIYPLAHGEVFEAVEETQRLNRLVADGRGDHVYAEPVSKPAADNVLRFPGPARRKSRDSAGRSHKRHGPPPPKSRE